MTATAAAGAVQTATANALATEQAMQTAAEAESAAASQESADAQATIDAAAAMTATAAAIPTATPVPPEAVTGEVVSNEAGQLTVRSPGTATARTFPVDPAAGVTRAGTPVAIEAVGAGDQVQMLVDRTSGAVTALTAEPPPRSESITTRLGLLVLALGTLGLIWWFILAKRNREEPFIIKRAAT